MIDRVIHYIKKAYMRLYYYVTGNVSDKEINALKGADRAFRNKNKKVRNLTIRQVMERDPPAQSIFVLDLPKQILQILNDRGITDLKAVAIMMDFEERYYHGFYVEDIGPVRSKGILKAYVKYIREFHKNQE